MKKRWIPILLLATALLLMGRAVAYAQGAENGKTVLLLLPVPQPDAISSGVHTAEAYTYRSAQPLLEQLSKLRAEGRVNDFELLPDRHAIRVTVTDDEGLRALHELGGVAGTRPMDAAGLACAAKGVQAVRDVLGAMAAMRTAPRSAQTTNPSITIYISPSGDYGNIYGQTDPNTTVTMVLKSARGTVKATETTTSNSSGYYYFWPDWRICVGYDWYPVPGDIVEVTAAGNTVSTIVTRISAFPDPTTDTVTGSTEPHRKVEVNADQTFADCDYTGNSATTTSDGTGAFSATITEGFDRSVSVTVWVYDANGNATSTFFYPPHIRIGYDGNLSGYLKPHVAYTASLKRGGSIISTFGGTTDDSGWYSFRYTQTLQAGDVIEVSGGGLVISTTFVEVSNLDFDPANDRITGNIGREGAGRRVRVSPSRWWEYECGWNHGCAAATADSSGNFTLDFGAAGFDLRRGDSDYDPAIYDDEGNVQEIRGRLAVPVVAVAPYDDHIRGYWYEPGVVVTMTVRDSGGAVKSTNTATTWSYGASFYGNLPSIEPGDSVEVSDGIHTLTVSSVPMLTAYLDAGTNTVSGSGPEGSTLVAWLWRPRFDPEYGRIWYVSCYTTTVSGGSYNIGFGDRVDAKAQDEVYVFYTDADGHKVEAYSHAFAINAEKGGDVLAGYTPTPDTEVVIELWRDGSVQAVITTTSSGSGYYYGNLSSDTPVTITQGDTVRVKPQGMAAYDLLIPELTVQEDPAHNRVTGRALANATVEVDLSQPATGRDWYVQTTADAGGAYVADFNGIYEWRSCTKAEVGACTRPKATYYNNEGHTVYIWGPSPPDVSADAYESDDTYTAASPYVGIQSHTFHTATDTDWISFTVGSDDVGTVYYLRTVNLGVNANTTLYLYDTDGRTLLESDTSYSPRSSQIVWRPVATGTYYIEVAPYSRFNTENCGSTYDFFIARYRVYLSWIMHNR